MRELAGKLNIPYGESEMTKKKDTQVKETELQNPKPRRSRSKMDGLFDLTATPLPEQKELKCKKFEDNFSNIDWSK